MQKGGIIMAKRTEIYTSCEANGKIGAERVAAMHRGNGKSVRVEHGQIPQWGSGNPYSSNYGETERGYRIIVEHN